MKKIAIIYKRDSDNLWTYFNLDNESDRYDLGCTTLVGILCKALVNGFTHYKRVIKGKHGKLTPINYELT